MWLPTSTFFFLGVRLSSFLHETEAHRLKLPEITRYLRQKPCTDASSSPTKKLFSADEDSVDSTCSGAALENLSAADDDEIIVLNDDDEETATATAVVGSSGATFSTDVVEAENPDGDESSEYVSVVVCPVCNCKFTQLTSGRFNAHLDQCLNRKAISNLIKEQDRDLSVPASSSARDGTKEKAGKRKSNSPGKARVQKKRSRSPLCQSKRIEDYFKPL